MKRPVQDPRIISPSQYIAPNIDQFLFSLLASLIIFWSLPTTAQLTIESVPPNAAEGKDVLLRVHNLPENLGSYTWYTGGKVVNSHQIVSYVIDTQTTALGPAYSGRETIYPNGSLLFQKVTLKDTGYYTLLATDKDYQSMQVTGQLHVYPELPKPSITSNNSLPEEHKDPVVLTCEPQTHDTTYLWLINSQSIMNSARLQLSKDNRTLTLLPVTRNDTGPYECETRNPVSAGRSDPFTLNVVSELPKPSITSNNSLPEEHKDPVVLTCEPQTHDTTYLWLINSQSIMNSARLQLSKDNRTLTLLPVTRNDTGPYECETRNPVSAGRSDPFTLNVVSEQNYTGYSVRTIVGRVIGALVLVALGASLGYFLYLRRTRRYHGISFTLTLILPPDPV
ncbi:Pregnancy-specific beta-1-glycoprotein 8 [Myotis davidii]|uniref:Pregnancy-specific beta-1-glycoprotein 8 n=1 Tax=Myotis davidii TaxID=225400 RepID=L5M523_MYODS|nr:Pregnancy-specific beta-1-glycoprotein 8 [Myotis davidii]